jgi:hypothetical protein
MSYSEFPLEFSGADCPQEEVLLDYGAGRLGVARAALLDRHAESCERCARVRAAQISVWNDLDAWKPVPVSESFNRDLWRRIDGDPQLSCRQRMAEKTHRVAEAMRRNFWISAAPLAVAALLIVTVAVMNHPGRRQGELPATSTTPAVVTVNDADQLERTLDDIQLIHEVDAVSASAKPNSKVM